MTSDASAGGVLIDQGVSYGLGKLADIYWPRRDGPAPLVLLWHGVGPDDRGTLASLATAVAGLGVAAMVPDWRSDASDGGRAHLLASLRFTRELARQRPGQLSAGDGSFVLAGWSRGGRMAASLALNPAAADGWRPSAVVCLAGGFHQATPLSPDGRSPIDDLAVTAARPVPFRLVHGMHDNVLAVSESRDFAVAAAAHGWPVRLAEPDTDHEGVVRTAVSRSGRRLRLVPRLGAAQPAGLLSADAIAEAAAR